MLDKIKDLSSQAMTKTGEAIDDIAVSLKEGVGNLSTAASNATGTLNEKAVRASTSQMYRILEIALQELEGRPLASRPMSLTASVNVGVAALELQIQLNQPNKNENPIS